MLFLKKKKKKKKKTWNTSQFPQKYEAIYNIDDNKKSFLSTSQIWFLKNHVTLKSNGVMAAENATLSSQE